MSLIDLKFRGLYMGRIMLMMNIGIVNDREILKLCFYLLIFLVLVSDFSCVLLLLLLVIRVLKFVFLIVFMIMCKFVMFGLCIIVSLDEFGVSFVLLMLGSVNSFFLSF